jgi:hypothetical protein
VVRRAGIDLDDLRDAFCLGVAGNFAGHLEQAGEAVDFVNVQTRSAALPKGIFPWYAPGSGTFLGAFPLSDARLVVPSPPGGEPQRIQVEPELATLCDVVRGEDGRVARLVPRWVAAFDDCSIRRPGARKISDKKNWGAGSKGLASTVLAIGDDLDPAGATASLRLASFLRRGDDAHAYGVDSAVPTYTLFGTPLLDWLVDRLREQRGSDDTPLEDVGALLDASGSARVLVGVGATRYEPYGETTFVEAGDEAIVVLYDSGAHAPDEVARLVAERRDDELHGASVLRRVALSDAGR